MATTTNNLTGSVQAESLDGLGSLRAAQDAGPVIAPFQNDTVAHLTRTDPGQSLPGECVHDWFRVGKRWRCHWCALVLPPSEP